MVRHIHATLNQLIDTYLSIPTAASRSALHKALFGLSRWYTIQLGDCEDRPHYIEYEDGEPVLLVFTDAERASSAAQSWIADRVETHATIEAIDLKELQAVLEVLKESGIVSLRYDHGPRSLLIPLEEAIEIAADHVKPVKKDIDTLVKAAIEGLGPVAEPDLWNAVRELPNWYLVADVDESEDPLVWILHDEPCVLVFTDQMKARSYAVEHGLEGCMTDAGRLIEVDPERALHCFRDLARRGVAGAVFNDGPFGFYASLNQLCNKAA